MLSGESTKETPSGSLGVDVDGTAALGGDALTGSGRRFRGNLDALFSGDAAGGLSGDDVGAGRGWFGVCEGRGLSDLVGDDALKEQSIAVIALLKMTQIEHTVLIRSFRCDCWRCRRNHGTWCRWSGARSRMEAPYPNDGDSR